MEDYLIGIGKRIKELRKEKGKTIQEVASKTDVTNGLISRIENGRTMPSLPVLFKIINALDVEVTHFFDGMPRSSDSQFIVIKESENSVIEKEDEAVGFAYNYIFSKQISSVGFEVVLLEVKPNSKRDKVVTDAYEFKYVLSGECSYVINEEEILLKTGDSIFFDGRIPHVPINRSNAVCKMLVLYFFL